MNMVFQSKIIIMKTFLIQLDVQPLKCPIFGGFTVYLETA